MEKNSKKIEKVQERAFRFVYEDYNSSYDNLLKKAKVPSLQIRRMRTMALETFKIMNKLSPSCLHNLSQVAMPRWVATGIHMQHDVIKQKIKHVWIKN
jgi:hypothetical protein